MFFGLSLAECRSDRRVAEEELLERGREAGSGGEEKGEDGRGLALFRMLMAIFV